MILNVQALNYQPFMKIYLGVARQHKYSSILIMKGYRLIMIIPILFGVLFYFSKILIPASSVNVPLFFIEIVSVILLIYYFVFKHKSLFKSKYYAILYLLVVCHIITLFSSSDFTRALEGIKTYLFALIILLSFSNYFLNISEEKLRKYLYLFEFSFVGLTLMNLIRIVLKNELYAATSFYLYKNNFILPYGNSNYIAQFMLFIGIANFMKFSSSRKASYGIVSIMAFISIVILNSRSALLSLLIIVILIIFKNFNWHKTGIKSLIGTISFFLILILFSRKFVFFKLILQRFQMEQSNITSRIEQYLHNINMLLNNNLFSFLFGQGMGTETSISNGLLIHNLIIKLLYSIGLIGTLIYISYIFSVFIDFKKISGYYSFLKGYDYATLSIGITSLVEPVLYTSYIEYFITLYLSIFIAKKTMIDKNNKLNNEQINKLNKNFNYSNKTSG